MRLGCDGHDITSKLPDDITVMTVTLAMGHHGQTSLLGYMVISQNKTAYLGYPTDVTMTMVALTAGYICKMQAP